MQKEEEILIKDEQGRIRGQFLMYNDDPRFILHLNTEPWKIPIEKGDILLRSGKTGAMDERTIIGITFFRSIPFLELIILAPKPIMKPNTEAPYIRQSGRDNRNQKVIIELRPGTKIIGGRNTGFYDNYGIILEAHHIGGDPKKFEDWAYHVLGPSAFGELATQWIFLADVGFPVSAPISITGFKFDHSKTIDDMLATGERELFEYFVANPNKIGGLSPKQFEKLVSSIYSNLGFNTESIGAWNQPDGGVDIIAVSKTDAGTEYHLAIQCKTSKNKISARPIRELAGVLDAFKAHQGVVATTSKFTTPARNQAEGHLWKIALQDRDELFRRMVSILLPNLDI